MDIRNNIAFFRNQLAGKDCRLIAVSKTHSIEKIQEAFRMAKKLCTTLAIVVLILCFTALSFGQSSSESSVKGNLAGVVTDPSGAVVQGAKVVITGGTGEKSIESDGSAPL